MFTENGCLAAQGIPGIQSSTCDHLRELLTQFHRAPIDDCVVFPMLHLLVLPTLAVAV
jgi:hypothetical protein